MSTAVVIENIVKSYQPGMPPAVDGVSLAIQPGELSFLLGPSGCGKTTLLRMVAGFFDPSAGRILFRTPAGERDVTHLPPNKRNTGMVFQSYALWPHMTVAENVAFGLEIRKVTGGEKARRIADALEVVQMAQYAGRKPNALSGGQQQRVALARALVIRPDVLLLDEPLSNLDAKLRIELRSEIRRICKSSGITTIYVTHDQKEALSMADTVAIMRAGKLVQTGNPEDLYRRPGSRFVAEFLGETNFISGKVISGDARGCLVQTAYGQLRSNSGWSGIAGGDVTISLRPEALRLGSNPAAQTTLGYSIVRGKITDRVYLGELAQMNIELKPAASSVHSDPTAAMRLKLSVLNPPAGSGTGGEVELAIAPEDVVVVDGA